MKTFSSTQSLFSPRVGFSLLVAGALSFACSSESDDAAGSGGAAGVVGSDGVGGAASVGGSGAGIGGTAAGGGSSAGGAGTSGGAPAAGGASGGGVGTGGATSGGSGSGGAASGGSASGGGPDGSGGMATGGADGSGGADGTGGTDAGGEFLLTSPSWEAVNNDGCGPDGADADCERFPKEHVATQINGDNDSPELNWSNAPEGTMSYVIVLHDLSNGNGHWAAWKMDASFTGLPAMLPDGSPLADPAGLEQTGIAGDGYFGSGACGNTYEFKLYALSTSDYSPSGGADAADIRDELDASSEVLGTSFVRLRSGEPYCTP